MQTVYMIIQILLKQAKNSVFFSQKCSDNLCGNSVRSQTQIKLSVVASSPF